MKIFHGAHKAISIPSIHQSSFQSYLVEKLQIAIPHFAPLLSKSGEHLW